MELFDFKAVRAPVCNAGKFLRPLAICLTIYYSFMYAICMFAFCVCVCMSKGERDGKRKKGGWGGGGGANDNFGGSVCVFVCDRFCTHMNSAQSACKLKSLQ